MRAPLGVTKGSSPRWKAEARRSVQNPEWAQRPRLSRMVTRTPRYRSRRSATRLGSLASREPDAGVRPVTERFACGAAAAAQRHLRANLVLFSEPVDHLPGIGHQIGTVVGDPDLCLQAGLQALKLGQPACRCGRVGQIDGQILERGGGLQEGRLIPQLDAQRCRRQGELPHLLIQPVRRQGGGAGPIRTLQRLSSYLVRRAGGAGHALTGLSERAHDAVAEPRPHAFGLLACCRSLEGGRQVGGRFPGSRRVCFR